MSYQVFISYRRKGAAELAQLLYLRLKEDGYETFFDVETMRSGKFNKQLYDRIDESCAVVAVLPPDALNIREAGEDWMRNELAYALQKEKKIIPVLMRDFVWPPNLPADIQDLQYCHGVSADMEYFDAVYERIKSLIDEVVQETANRKGKNPLTRLGEELLCMKAFEEAKGQFERAIRRNPECAEAYLGLAMAEYEIADRNEFSQFYSENLIQNDANIKVAEACAVGNTKAYLQSLVPPKCRQHGGVACCRCDHCNAFMCEDCQTNLFVEKASVLEGKRFCPECVHLFHGHCGVMKKENTRHILFQFAAIIALVLVVICVSIMHIECLLWTVLAIGIIGGILLSINERADDDGPFFPYCVFAVLGAPLILLWFIGKRVCWLVEMTRLMRMLRTKRPDDCTDAVEIVQIYLQMVEITRKLHRSEPA